MELSRWLTTSLIGDDYSAFAAVWREPAGGLEGYLSRFLESEDSTFQHISIWSLVQLLESGDAQLEALIRSSTSLLPLVRRLADAPQPSDASDDEEESGAREIAELARSAVELIEDGGEVDAQ